MRTPGMAAKPSSKPPCARRPERARRQFLARRARRRRPRVPRCLAHLDCRIHIFRATRRADLGRFACPCHQIAAARSSPRPSANVQKASPQRAQQPLVPGAASRSTFNRATSIGTSPTVCAASSRNSAPCSRAIAPISSAGCKAPVTFEACTSATGVVRDAARGESRPARSRPSHCTGRESR